MSASVAKAVLQSYALFMSPSMGHANRPRDSVLATGSSLAFNTWKQIATVCQLAFAAFNYSVMHKSSIN